MKNAQIISILNNIKEIDIKKDNNLSTILNNFNIGRYEILVSDKPINCYAYTKWNILGSATIVIDATLLVVPNILKTVLIHELLHIKQGYWKSWFLLFFRKRIEYEIEKEVDNFLST